MGVSPFMAFAKGAFEGYNQIQEEKRALASEMALEKYKAGLTGQGSIRSNWFTTHDATTGQETQHFQFSDAKDEKTRQQRDLMALSQVFTPEYYERLSAGEQQQATSLGVSMMQNYHGNLVIRDEGGDIVTTPNEHTFPTLIDNPVWQTPWKEVLAGEYLHKTPKRPNQYTNVSMDNESGDITSQLIEVDDFAPDEWAGLSNKYAQQININPQSAPAFFAKNHQNAIFINEKVPNPLNQNELMYEVFSRISNAGVIDDRDTKAVKIVIEGLKQHHKARKFSSYDVFKALELHSPSKYSTDDGAGGIRTIRNPVKYMERLGFNLEDLRVKEKATFQARKITENVQLQIVNYQDRHNGSPPPQGTILTNISQFLSAWTGREGIKEQIAGLGIAAYAKFGVEDKVGDRLTASGYVQEKYDEMQDKFKKADSLDSRVVESAKTAAAMDFYMTMLAYQLAVAIQGGTGGRTVSDQDVENMYRAFGKRMFVNNRVQLSVLNEVQNFLTDLDSGLKFFTQSANDTNLRGVNAANSFHKMIYGGLDAGQLANTTYMSDVLEGRVDNVFENKQGVPDELVGIGAVPTMYALNQKARNVISFTGSTNLEILRSIKEQISNPQWSRGYTRTFPYLDYVNSLDPSDKEGVDAWLQSNLLTFDQLPKEYQKLVLSKGR